MTTVRTRNWHYLAGLTIARGFMALAARVSFGHIMTTASRLGAGDAWLWPIMIDGLAGLGMLLRCNRFARSTRRFGLGLAAVAGTASLVANVYAGHTTGDRITGAMAVTVFMIAEIAADQMKPAEADPAELAAEQVAEAERIAAEATAAQAAQPAAQAILTRKANAARKAAEAAAVPEPEPVHMLTARPARSRRSGPRLGKVAPGWMTPEVRLAVANAN